ncbi:mitochondrial cytochrome c oxidase assembly factor [Colletotrichum tofieldiae]|uniref:Mitochondrial cytochrome C oxidase assembly factor n=3 Tax=Colletotrichum spaethianum species complex TaxID=2707349 RepID=A0A166SKM9_9PEZI|nr:mitochondrial cytochrome c oxidase assembly factor [Colletotrichum incanum]KZL70862.1 mitochondrial cytochrome C oxidase assembly factor [Colletotrichum tofieldiae]GJC86749.1 protein PET100, mitochondrial [Colletotrichum liriopes]OHW95039.1 mitochondrial cytochrome c oxidase assembly factor [Colletotrichum incanum]GKT53672.1 mitochondrial cytochrome c oxidase assembly factor [Colletotrichum tofieldiae]
MGGLNLEVFKFGMYVMFPIGVMYYFGTNLDNRFAVPEFWPKAEHSHKIPFDRDEIKSEYVRLARRQRAVEEMRREREAAQAAQNPPSNEEQS